MKYSLLDNGVDSLKGAHQSLQNFEEVHEEGLHYLKDAVIFLNHGIEILFKLILKKHSPALMFTDLKAYQKAKQDMKSQGKKDVFEVDKKLRTITLEEAVQRVEYLCDIDIPIKLKADIYYINQVRNQIMHYGIDMNGEQLITLIIKLKLCYEESVEFLQSHIENLEKLIHKARFVITRSEYEHYERMSERYAEETEAYSEYLEGAYEDLGEGKW